MKENKSFAQGVLMKKNLIRNFFPHGAIAILRRSFYLYNDVRIEHVVEDGEIKTMITYTDLAYHTRIENVIEQWLYDGHVEDDPGTTGNTIIFPRCLAPALADHFFFYFPVGYEKAVFPPVSVTLRNGEGHLTYPSHCVDCFNEINRLMASRDIIEDYNFISFQDEIKTLEVPLSFFNRIKDSLIRASLIRMLVRDSKLLILYASPLNDFVYDLCSPLLTNMYYQKYGLDYEID